MVKKVIRIFVRAIIILLCLVLCLVLFATFQPKFTKNALLLKLDSMRDDSITTMIRIGIDGIRWEKLSGGGWRYSPDGQYAVTTYTRPSHHGIKIIRTDTFAIECFDIKEPSLNNPLQCDFLPLYDGKWWSPTTGLVMSKPNSSITNAVSLVSASPDDNWLLTQTKSAYTMADKWNYGVWSLIARSGDKQVDFELPIVQGQYCDLFTYYDWRENAQQFAIYHQRQNHIFIWQMTKDHPQLVSTIALDTCGDTQYWSKGKFTGLWP